MPVFECRTEVQVPPARLFEFITRTENMLKVSPPEVDMVIEEAPEILTMGSRIVFKMQAFGIPQELVHEIVEFNPPRGFREKMTKGPLASWIHDYIVEPHGHGHAALINRIEFEPPGGMLGMLVTAERILSRLEDSYASRGAALKKVLES